jgi:4a-hydroxytetrahydrobiopterin dehydratase
MADLLTDEEIESRLEDSEWTREGDEIVRNWEFDDFAGALAFVNRVGAAAEEANHHPDILLHGWNKVRLSLTNHSAGGLTAVDFDMGGRFGDLAG